ncbi:hypothetical protein BDV27DRAFT_136224 [Aspergillus caelatus]|uniref:Uncharacterized protein n=1 Tax=Aspergillus caelatus TaxID=61420 RepID=A0A5N6ZP56_9EURO|nr:uncharacterized protein BDV27DRAFT_136224 [Aspergillus caelatus]KAE8359401.1 hypothetical protein BDV27DRAFT_136224 [Aspergillus caelatus]
MLPEYKSLNLILSTDRAHFAPHKYTPSPHSIEVLAESQHTIRTYLDLIINY